MAYLDLALLHLISCMLDNCHNLFHRVDQSYTSRVRLHKPLTAGNQYRYSHVRILQIERRDVMSTLKCL